MAVEIELKARLDDIEQVKERLSVLGDYCRSYEKSDSYWLLSPGADSVSTPPSGVRVRREHGQNADGTAYESVMVTFKTREISGSIEVNDEREFTVSDAALFEELLHGLGMHLAIRKEKKGWAWNIPAQAAGRFPVLAELSLVTGLGWFLELEILAADDNAQTVEECRRRLLDLLEKTGIPADRIESRPYTAMLAAL
jgi:adenylate cyclase class 2